VYINFHILSGYLHARQKLPILSKPPPSEQSCGLNILICTGPQQACVEAIGASANPGTQAATERLRRTARLAFHNTRRAGGGLQAAAQGLPGP
jgi:hypothetical protein